MVTHAEYARRWLAARDRMHEQVLAIADAPLHDGDQRAELRRRSAEIERLFLEFEARWPEPTDDAPLAHRHTSANDLTAQ